MWSGCSNTSIFLYCQNNPRSVFLFIKMPLSSKVLFKKNRGGPANEVWVMSLKGDSTSPRCLVWGPRAMGWVWWCYGIIFIELQHEDTLPVLPWIIQPPSALLENAVFFWELWERGSCSFSRRRRLNACCLFYMTRHLRCAFGCQCLVLSELFKFTACSQTRRLPLHRHHHSRTRMPHTLLFFCMKTHIARFASLPSLSLST